MSTTTHQPATSAGDGAVPAVTPPPRTRRASLGRAKLARRLVVLVIVGLALGATVAFLVQSRNSAQDSHYLIGNATEEVLVTLQPSSAIGAATGVAADLAALPGVVEVSATGADSVTLYLKRAESPAQLSTLEADLAHNSSVLSFKVQPYKG